MDGILKLAEIINILEINFPLELQEKWDNSGLIIGDKNDEINKVQISLDITERVINNAISKGCNLIISHHPTIFGGIKKINDSDVLGKKILKLMRNKINVYSLHTNLDSAKDGLNLYLAKKLGGENIKVISENIENLCKIDFTISIDEKEKLEEVLFKNSFNFITKNIDEKKFSIEIIELKRDLYKCLNIVKNSIKEIEYSIYSLENKEKLGTGLGRIYNLPKEVVLDEYVDFVKEKLDINHVKLVRANEKNIKKVALVNGSGAEFWEKAERLGADLFITGDVKYHTALDSFEKGMNILDIGHYEAEHFFNEIISEKLKTKCEIIVFNEKNVFEMR